MSIPLLVNQESNLSEHNLNINKKIKSNSEIPKEKNKNIHISDINSQIAKEIYFFKDDILKEFNTIIDKLIIRFVDNFKIINEKFAKNEENFDLVNKRIDEITEKNAFYDKYEEKINDLFKYKRDNEKEMKSHNFFFNCIKNQIRDGFKEYDLILNKFKSTQEIVGEKKKFRTYPELIRFIYQNLNDIKSLQEKSNLDFKGYKSKLDSTISGFKQQINVVTEAMKNFTISSVRNSEERIKGIMNNFDERIVEIRSDNIKNLEILKKEYEKLFSEAADKIKEQLNKKLDNDILIFNDSLNSAQKQFEEKLFEYKNKLDIFKTNEDNIIEIIKEQISSLQNNLNNYNNILNQKTIENKNEKSKTQRNSLRSSQLINNINNIVKSFNNNININNSLRNKKNDIFNLSNIKQKSNEIREKEDEKKRVEISHNRYNSEKSEEQITEKNRKKIISLKNSLFNENNTVYKIKKIVKQKSLDNYSSNIKDNNNTNDIKINNIKSLDESKDKSLPKLIDIKKGETINASSDIKVKTYRKDQGNNTSAIFKRNKTRKLSQRILSSNNIKKEEDQKNNSNLNVDISNIRKKFVTKDESKLNRQMSIYDVTFKPYKDYDRNKFLEEENKKSSKNLIVNNDDKKNVNINNKKEYEYINSKGELSNIIEIPPPKNVIYKSIFQID